MLLKDFYTLFHLNTCLPELCDRCSPVQPWGFSGGNETFYLEVTHRYRNREILWMSGLGLFAKETFTLQLFWVGPPFTTFIGVNVWNNLTEFFCSRRQWRTSGWGPVHTGECIVTVGPVIGQEVGGRRPAQEFDSWRPSSCSDKFLSVLKWLFSTKMLQKAENNGNLIHLSTGNRWNYRQAARKHWAARKLLSESLANTYACSKSGTWGPNWHYSR